MNYSENDKIHVRIFLYSCINVDVFANRPSLDIIALFFFNCRIDAPLEVIREQQ